MSGFIDMSSVSDIKLNGVDVVKIAQGVNTLWEKSVIEPFNVKNISQSVATVDWNTGADNRNLQYSEDKSTWTNVPYADGKYTLTIPVGKKYYVQGNSTNFGGWWGSDQDVEIGGYVLSLHYPTMEQPSNQGVSYQKLFSKNGNSTADSKLHFDFSRLKLPVLKVNANGYEQAFGGCLSVTTLNSDVFYTDGGYSLGQFAFANMFKGCTNLTSVNGFNVRRFVNVSSWDEFSAMFDGCTNLQYVSDDFFDTTLTPSEIYFEDKTCEYMFRNCTSLIHPPKLPSPRGRRLQFRNMFQGCTSLTNANSDRIMPNYTELGMSGTRLGTESIFQGMFQGCTGLTSMHDLSSYTMTNYGNSYFYQMYYGCTGITSIDAAKMPSGVATTNCFREMFRDCTGITSVPSGFIKPTNTAESCFQGMFRDCSGITTIPSGLIQATTFTKNCCNSMFYGCNHLTAIPSGFMSPTTVAEGCCQSMFENCSALTTIPSGILPALTMEKNCYHSMFRSCSSLQSVATDLLPATTMAEGCYTIMFQYSRGFGGLHLGATDIGTAAFANWMFFDCGITSMEVDFKEWTAATTEWMLRTSNNGTFIKYDELPEIYDTSHIPVGWYVVNKHEMFYFEDRSGASNTLTCTKTGSDTQWLSVEYSTDKQTWTSWDLTQSLTIPANGRVYLRGSNTTGFGKDNNNYNTFDCTGNYAVGGDLFSIMSDNLDGYPSRFGNRTFQQSSTLVDASKLVFGNRKASTVAFTWMFDQSASLSSVPSSIDVTYPNNVDLSVSNSHFYRMFYYTNIENFPTFPNISAIGYRGMYNIAMSGNASPNTSLKYVDLSNITTLYTEALANAFQHCRNLEVVKIGISAWGDFEDSTASNYRPTINWLGDVRATGVFCKNSTLPVTRGDSYIPNNWSIADLNGKLYDPVITDNAGTITIAEGGGGSSSTIYYTTDGSEPDPTSTVYTAPFQAASGTVIKAFADYSGNVSDVIVHSNVTTITVQ